MEVNTHGKRVEERVTGSENDKIGHLKLIRGGVCSLSTSYQSFILRVLITIQFF